jgi:hypothetical protein
MSVVASIFDESAAATARAAVADALESNHIVFFRRCPIRLPDEPTLNYLRSELPARLRLKNITYHPQADRITGLDAEADTANRIRAILTAHLEEVRTFLQGQAPYLTYDWTIGTCSVRPVQERGRNLKPHASNELVHIDAGAYGATDGDRILRFFVNFSDHEDRVWASKGPFEQILERFGQRAGLLDARGCLAVRLTKSRTDRALSAVVRGIARFNPLAVVLDTSPYDRAMRRLHNYMKDDAGFRADRRVYEEIRFPPRSAWMVFTDSVSHASLSGQFAFVTTIVVRRSRMRRPQFAPFNILMSRAGAPRPLAAAP